MKNILFLFLLFFPFIIYSQNDAILSGVVVEQNSKFNTGKLNYIPNTQIKSVGASPQISDVNGEFTLVFADKPIGKTVRIYASKNGFEVVNEKELKNTAVLGRLSPVKVILCKEGKLYENQVAYYKIAEEAAIENYKRRIAILESEGREKDLLFKELENEFKQEVTSLNQAKDLLSLQLKKVEKQAKELADNWITVNLDDQSESYQKAFRAFIQKDLSLALAILDSVDLKNRLETNTVEKIKEENLIDTLQAKIALREKQIQQDINQLVFKAELYILLNAFSKAEVTYELALEYSDDPDLVQNFALFLHRQNRYDKAQKYYLEALKICSELAKEYPIKYNSSLGNIYTNLGVLYSELNDFSNSKNALFKSLEIREKLAAINPLLFKSDVALTLLNIGNMYLMFNDYENAEVAYKQSLEIFQNEPKHKLSKFEGELAGVQMNLGVLYTKSKAYEKALNAYNRSLEINKRLAGENPRVYLPDLADNLVNLGTVYSKVNDVNSSEKAYKESLEIYGQLIIDNPRRYEPPIAKCYMNLGVMILSHRKDYEQAHKYLSKSKGIFKRLAKYNPQQFEPYLADNLVNLGSLYRNVEAYSNALDVYSEALNIYQRLIKENPQQNEYKIASVIMGMGNVYADKKEFNNAENAYMGSLEIYQGLAKDSPFLYKPNVASIFEELGKLYFDFGNNSKAEKSYYGSLLIYRELAYESPEEYKLDLCRILLGNAVIKNELFDENIDKRFQKEGLDFVHEAKEILNQYNLEDSNATVQNYREVVETLEESFTKVSEKEIDGINQIIFYEEKIKMEENPELIVSYQEKIVDIVEKFSKSNPDNQELQILLSRSYGQLSWFNIISGNFREAENVALKGMEIEFSEESNIPCLALALLFQDKFDEAKEIYLEWKDKPYGDNIYSTVFLDDLNYLEKTGINHKDIEAIRQLILD